MGVHVFFVQMRGADLAPLPGIEMGDIGAKLGDNDTSIGYLRMNQVRIPRRHLMERRQHVTRDGVYVKMPHPGSMDNVANKTAKTGASAGAGADAGAGALSSKSKSTVKSKAHYITMLKTRVALTNTAAASLAKVRS